MVASSAAHAVTTMSSAQSSAVTRTNITVLYGESKLQKTISFTNTATVSQAKEYGLRELRTHLLAQPGVPELEFDSDCTDFYPSAEDSDPLSTLGESNPTIVVWPKGPTNAYTPSPIMDTLAKTTAELRELHILHGTTSPTTESKKKKKKKKKGSSTATLVASESSVIASESIPPTKYSISPAEILNQFAAMDQSIANLRQTILAQGVRISTLQRDITDVMKVALGVCHSFSLLVLMCHVYISLQEQQAIGKISIGILLDTARAELTKLCGYNSWDEWESKSADKNAMIIEATTILQAQASSKITPH